MPGSYKENGDSYSGNEEEQGSMLSLLITFAGLVVATVIICTIVWTVTHKEHKPDVGSLKIPEASQASAEVKTEEPEEVAEIDADGDVDPVNGDATMLFEKVEENVTAKDAAFLRNVPSTDGITAVVGQLMNGDTLKRVGINKTTGWSKLIYNGTEVFAVTYMLTDDTEYKTESLGDSANRVVTSDGHIVLFEDCDDQITAKEYVNLRSEPSTVQGTATVSAHLSSGTVARRTGYSVDSGWSRVEYNGNVLYVVSSYTQGAGQ